MKEEMKKYVQRDSVWPLPDAKKQVEGGLPPFIAYWQRQVRLCLYKVPRVMEGEDIMEARKNYIRVATEIKNAAMAIKEESEMPEFYKKAADYFGFDKDIFRRCASPVHLLKFSHRRLKMKVESTGFPYTVRKQVIRKKSFIPPQLTRSSGKARTTGRARISMPISGKEISSSGVFSSETGCPRRTGSFP